MLAAKCPSCRRQFRAPGHLAGRRVTCPRCGEPVSLPAEEEAPAEAAPPAPPEPPPMPPAVRLGVASLALGLGSVLLLCLPFVGYVSIALSGAGLLIGAAGLLRALRGDGGPSGYALAGGAGAARGFGARASDYALSGVVVCLLALALELWPLLR